MFDRSGRFQAIKVNLLYAAEEGRITRGEAIILSTFLCEGRRRRSKSYAGERREDATENNEYGLTNEAGRVLGLPKKRLMREVLNN